MIDSKQASAALADIGDIAGRVRQSLIYNLSSLIMIMWGVLALAGNLLVYLLNRYAGYAWLLIYIVGIAGSIAISAYQYRKSGVRTFDTRMLLSFVLYVAFGFFTNWLGQFTPRQAGAFWPIYYMIIYSIAGIWVGRAFTAIGLSVTAPTLISYFYAGSAFGLCMAFVNGGGLILGGLWMRRS